MVAQDLLQTVLALSTEDRLDLLSRLENSLREQDPVPPLSEAHRRILEERLAEFEADPLGGSTWPEVKARLLTKLGQA